MVPDSIDWLVTAPNAYAAGGGSDNEAQLRHLGIEVDASTSTTVSASTLQFDLALPLQDSLLGAHVYVQTYCIAPGENQLQMIASNGIGWLIGNH
ncbi:MAG: hypothetical protein ACI89X_002802 [Planctomycetota bacterium]